MSALAAVSGSPGEFASFDVPAWAWLALVGAIVAMLIVDLLLVHRTAHVITIKEATIESAIWVSIGLAFGVVLLVWQGGQAGGEYYAGFLIEKSLSIDNVFVWAVIFSFFAVPRAYLRAPGVFVHPFRLNPYTDSGVSVHLGQEAA